MQRLHSTEMARTNQIFGNPDNWSGFSAIQKTAMVKMYLLTHSIEETISELILGYDHNNSKQTICGYSKGQWEQWDDEERQAAATGFCNAQGIDLLIHELI